MKFDVGTVRAKNGRLFYVEEKVSMQCPCSVMSARPFKFLKPLNVVYGEAKNVTKMNGAAARTGNTCIVKNGITNDRFPIIICRNLRENFREIFNVLLILPEIRIVRIIYA